MHGSVQLGVLGLLYLMSINTTHGGMACKRRLCIWTTKDQTRAPTEMARIKRSPQPFSIHVRGNFTWRCSRVQ
ncbi:hypothetical protein PLICRDRAFT_594027 [Plicaturopsis crispa FD-325 SS-3]|nr:hypothetical protein PLICRDRAFT_594027 [Plicaturopsis crispa FD-325 SS-3]